MQTLIRDTLDAWREAERTLESMPPSSPDHETVTLVIVELRETYQRLTDSRDVSREIVDRCRVIVDDARGLLLRAHGERAEVASPAAARSADPADTESTLGVRPAEAT